VTHGLCSAGVEQSSRGQCFACPKINERACCGAKPTSLLVCLLQRPRTRHTAGAAYTPGWAARHADRSYQWSSTRTGSAARPGLAVLPPCTIAALLGAPEAAAASAMAVALLSGLSAGAACCSVDAAAEVKGHPPEAEAGAATERPLLPDARWLPVLRAAGPAAGCRPPRGRLRTRRMASKARGEGVDGHAGALHAV